MRCNLLTSTVVLAILALSSVSAEQWTTNEYLDEANRLLLRGNFQKAIAHYDTAIEKDPQNYLTYFKRATTLLSVSKHSSAIRDFTRAIELRPDFEQAYYQRARVYLKEGNYSGAEEDIAIISGKGSAAMQTKSKDLRDKVALAKELNEAAEQALADKNYAECDSKASKVIRASPLYATVLKTRAACRVASGDIEGASADLGRLVRIRPGDLETLNMLADLHFLTLDEPDRGMEYVRACLVSDPDNKSCKVTYTRLRGLQRKLAKVEADVEKSKWNACNRAVAPLSGEGGLLGEVDSIYASFIVTADIPGTVPSKLATRLAGLACKSYAKTKRWESAIAYCSRVIDAEPENADALSNLFETQLESSMLDQAQATLNKLNQVAASGGISQQTIHQSRMKLENQKRMASRKDYYKILSVSKDASSVEIKKAFRKMAHQWHPDRYRGDLPKEKVEEKMADINLAYEVLMDEEKRASFDQGHDPNDPTGGAGPGGSGGFGSHPFAHPHGGGGKPVFFQQGGGSKQQFSFQFGGPGGFPF
ncbi:hypothetical protein LPJ66_000259 [Kickxella alabastrina]|uniref:Uncharacterized protein n=1 Tax=Kickxella alabastrina TaxID=61397 RepID=A0ACC1IWK3_9FUNG|nr:hypothetical protein LPJ66_000259 [Kickxella alabastrina]